MPLIHKLSMLEKVKLPSNRRFIDRESFYMNNRIDDTQADDRFHLPLSANRLSCCKIRPKMRSAYKINNRPGTMMRNIIPCLD